MNKYFRLLLDPKFRFSVLAAKGFYKTMPDKKFYEKSYWLSYGKKLNLGMMQQKLRRMKQRKSLFPGGESPAKSGVTVNPKTFSKQNRQFS